MFPFVTTALEEIQNGQIDVRSEYQRQSSVPKRVSYRRCIDQTDSVNVNINQDRPGSMENSEDISISSEYTITLIVIH